MDAFEAAASGKRRAEEKGEKREKREKSSERIFRTRSRGAAWNAVDWPVVRQFSSTSLRHEKLVNCFFEMPEKPEGTVSFVVPQRRLLRSCNRSKHRCSTLDDPCALWPILSLAVSIWPRIQNARLVTRNSVPLTELRRFHPLTFADKVCRFRGQSRIDERAGCERVL